MATEFFKPLVAAAMPASVNPAAPVVALRGRDDSRQSLPAAGEALPQNSRVPQVDERRLGALVAQFKEHVQTLKRELQFSVDEESGHTIVKVFNSDTQELIRQIPSEDFLELARHMDEIEGLLFSESV